MSIVVTLIVLAVLSLPFVFLGVIIADNNKIAVNIAEREEEWLQLI